MTDHVSRARQQAHVDQLESDKCQAEIGISGTCKSQIRVTCGIYSADAKFRNTHEIMDTCCLFRIFTKSGKREERSREVPNVEVPNGEILKGTCVSRLTASDI
jgi:hypothetical protein